MGGKSQVSLRDLAKRRGIVIGTAVSPAALSRDLEYRKILSREFNSITPEYQMEALITRPSRERFDFTLADETVSFARRSGMQVRGHPLIWHTELPNWLKSGTFTQEELQSIFENHIDQTIQHFRNQFPGTIRIWNVVNEAISEDGQGLRESIWARVGMEPEDYIEMAFRIAHRTDPQARLFYNDYGGEWSGLKANAIFELVRRLKQKDVPIHGVGFQMHLHIDENSSWKKDHLGEFQSNMRQLESLGLSIDITELDVRIRSEDGITPEEIELQAKMYRDALRACLSLTRCSSFTMWGFTDRYSWIPKFFPGFDTGLIFDFHFLPKPAYGALFDVLD